MGSLPGWVEGARSGQASWCQFLLTCGNAAFPMSKHSVLVLSLGRSQEWEDHFLPLGQQSGRGGGCVCSPSRRRRGFCSPEPAQAASWEISAWEKHFVVTVTNNHLFRRWRLSERALAAQGIRRRRSNKKSLSCLD